MMTASDPSVDTNASTTGLTDWLVHRFVPDADQTSLPRVRYAHGVLASVVGILCNVALSVAKGVVGVLSGSLSIVADAVNNLTDAASNIVSLVGFRLASKPADRGHPYGHGRIEYLSGVLVSFIILAIALELIRTSVEKILHPVPAGLSMVTVAVLLASMAVKAWMSHFNRAVGRRIGSVTLEATATDARNDVITTGAVLAAAVFSRLTGVDLDGWAGLAVGVFIFWSGLSLVRDTLNPLLGQAPDPRLVQHIHDTIMSYPGVLGTHDLMIHDYGPGRQFASAHVEMAAEIDPVRSHEVLDQIEHHFTDEENIPLVLHYDPIVTFDPDDQDLRHWLGDEVRNIDPRLTVHDLRTVTKDAPDGSTSRTTVYFDCVRPDPDDLDLTDDELRTRIAALVKRRFPDMDCRITVDSGYASTQA